MRTKSNFQLYDIMGIVVSMNLNKVACFTAGDVKKKMKINAISCMGTIITLK